MTSIWSIEGEAGKALDATVRTLESLSIDAASISFRSLDSDELAFSISPFRASAVTLPELGQTITVFREGTRFFHGHVTGNPVSVSDGEQTISVVVSGPWWWLERINLTSSKVDETGLSAERISYVFGTTASGVNLQTAINALIDRAIALGAPMARGSTATFFDVPRITLNQSTCGQALTELVRLVPDCMVYFDYSTTVPTINVTRRATATEVNFTVGTVPFQSCSVNPVYELQVSQVRLPFIQTDVRGLALYSEQSSGTPATGRVQMLTVSGPELDTFLPNTLFDKYELSTSPVASGLPGTLVGREDTNIAAAMKKNGFTGIGPMTVGPADFGGNAKAAAVSYVNQDGTALVTTGKHIVLGGDPPDWIEGYTFDKISISGEVYWTFNDRTWTGSQMISYTVPQWWFDVGWTKTIANAYEIKSGLSTFYYSFFAKSFAFDGYLVNATNPQTGSTGTGATTTQFTMPVGFSTADNYYVGSRIQIGNPSFIYTITAYVGSTRRVTISGTFPVAMNGYTFILLDGHPVYRPSDFTFISPPAGLAANLKAAQDFIPYAGNVNLTEQDAGGTRYRGKVVNIAGSVTAHATMKALVAGEDIDLVNGTTSIDLGAPPRLDFRTLTDKIRRTAQDNFEYVT